MNRNRPSAHDLALERFKSAFGTANSHDLVHWRVRCAKTRTLTLVTHPICPCFTLPAPKFTITYGLRYAIFVQKEALCARPGKLSVSAARQVRANAAPDGIGLGKDLTPPKGFHGTFTAQCVMHVMGRAVASRLLQRGRRKGVVGHYVMMVSTVLYCVLYCQGRGPRLRAASWLTSEADDKINFYHRVYYF